MGRVFLTLSAGSKLGVKVRIAKQCRASCFIRNHVNLNNSNMYQHKWHVTELAPRKVERKLQDSGRKTVVVTEI